MADFGNSLSLKLNDHDEIPWVNRDELPDYLFDETSRYIFEKLSMSDNQSR